MIKVQFVQINQATDYTNQSTDFLVLFSWGSSFTIEAADDSTASGSILAYVATNSLVIIPPNYTMEGWNGAGYGVFMNQEELWKFLLS